jgi:hypothetical protein
MAFQIMTCISGNAFLVPEGRDESSPAIYCWEKDFSRTSAVGTVEDRFASDQPGSSAVPIGLSGLIHSPAINCWLLSFCPYGTSVHVS